MHNNTNKQQPGQVIDVKKIKEDFEKIIKTIKENIEKQQSRKCPLICPISFAKKQPKQKEHSDLRNLLLVKQCPPRICKPKPVFPKIDLNQLFKPKQK